MPITLKEFSELELWRPRRSYRPYKKGCGLSRKEYQKLYYLDHKDEKKEYNREWFLKHPGKRGEYSKKWRLCHPEERREKDKEYYEKNKEKILETIKECQLKNPEKCAEFHRKQQAKRKRHLGFEPLNEHFAKSHAHHIDEEHVIYLPAELHRSVAHNVFTGFGMQEINLKAFDFMAYISPECIRIRGLND